MGFYHMDTKEGYEVLLKRINQRISNLDDKITQTKGGIACCCILLVLMNAMWNELKLLEKLKKDRELCQTTRRIVTLRLASYGPKAQLDIPDDLMEQSKRAFGLSNNSSSTNSISNNASYFYDHKYPMTGGGGCGGGAYVYDPNGG